MHSVRIVFPKLLEHKSYSWRVLKARVPSPISEALNQNQQGRTWEAIDDQAHHVIFIIR